MKHTFLYTLIFGFLLFTASCERNMVEFDMDPECLYLTMPSDKMKFSVKEGDKVTFEVWRGNTREAASVPLVVKGDLDVLSAPAKAEFAKGESKAVVEVKYDIDDLDFGGNYSLDITIPDEEQLAISGTDEMSLTVSRKLTLKPVCTGIYYSDGYEAEWEQDLCVAEEDPSFYAFPDCWVKGADFIFQMVDGQPVFPEVIDTGDDWGYGAIVLNVLEAYLEDGVITLYVEYYEPSDDYSWGEGVETFTLPDDFSF